MAKLARTQANAARGSRLYITAWAAVASAAAKFRTMRIQKSADANSLHAPHGARPATRCYRSLAARRRVAVCMAGPRLAEPRLKLPRLAMGGSWLALHPPCR